MQRAGVSGRVCASGRFQRIAAFEIHKIQLAERRTEHVKKRPLAERRLVQMALRIGQPRLKRAERLRAAAQQRALFQQHIPPRERLPPQAGKIVLLEKMRDDILHREIRLPVFFERQQQDELILVVIARAVFALFRGDDPLLLIKAKRLRGQPQQPRDLADFVIRHGLFSPFPRPMRRAAARSPSAIDAPAVSIITSTGLGPRPSEKHW